MSTFFVDKSYFLVYNHRSVLIGENLMKWLRASLFKNNNDKFIFEEEVNIDIANFDASIKGVEDVFVRAELTRNGQDKILVDLTISGNYKLISSRSLELISVPFDIVEREEYIDRTILFGDEDIDILTMDNYLDISPLVEELIILNAPRNFYLEDEKIEKIEGKDWQLLQSEDLSSVDKRENPFAALGEIFKDK